MVLNRKFLAAALASAILAFSVYAEDVWGGDEWSGGWDGEAGSSFAQENRREPGFWERFKINVDASLFARYYFNGSSAGSTTACAIPSLKPGFDYEGDSTKFSGKLKLDEQTLRYENEMILDEFQADLFVGDWVLSAGKMRVVWGKGDKLHVLDNFNSDNYYDFLIPDYLERRNSEYMFRAQYNSPLGFRAEGIYTPVMHGDTYAQKGVWVPRSVSSIKNIIGSQSLAISTYNDLLSAASLQDGLYPDTYRLEYGQFGAYVNFSAGPVDIGVSYYNGHNKQVSADLSGVVYAAASSSISALSAYAGLPDLHYDKKQAFGIDAQMPAGPFTLRAEFVYNLTKDTGGDDPWVHNNSIGYLFGFEVGLPLHNLNLNFQMTGNAVLKNGEIGNIKAPAALGSFALPDTKKYDVDYDPTGCYTNHKIVLQLKDTFYYEKVEAVVKAIYGIERKDLVLMPELSYKVRDGWKAILSGLFIHSFGEDTESEFYGWLDNSFIQLGVNYTF